MNGLTTLPPLLQNKDLISWPCLLVYPHPFKTNCLVSKSGCRVLHSNEGARGGAFDKQHNWKRTNSACLLGDKITSSSNSKWSGMQQNLGPALQKPGAREGVVEGDGSWERNGSHNVTATTVTP